MKKLARKQKIFQTEKYAGLVEYIKQQGPIHADELANIYDSSVIQVRNEIRRLRRNKIPIGQTRKGFTGLRMKK